MKFFTYRSQIESPDSDQKRPAKKLRAASAKNSKQCSNPLQQFWNNFNSRNFKNQECMGVDSDKNIFWCQLCKDYGENLPEFGYHVGFEIEKRFEFIKINFINLVFVLIFVTVNLK